MSERTIETYNIVGQRVTLERTQFRWIVTGWENGIPVARKTIRPEIAADILSKYRHFRTVW